MREKWSWIECAPSLLPIDRLQAAKSDGIPSDNPTPRFALKPNHHGNEKRHIIGPLKLRLELCHGFRDLDTNFGLDVWLDFRKNAPESRKCLPQIPGFGSLGFIVLLSLIPGDGLIFNASLA